MEKRYFVLGYGWNGWYGELEDNFKYGAFFDNVEDAMAEYDRLWEDDLGPDEGACVYDRLEKRFVVVD